jgi:hypothetical protein
MILLRIGMFSVSRRYVPDVNSSQMAPPFTKKRSLSRMHYKLSAQPQIIRFKLMTKFSIGVLIFYDVYYCHGIANNISMVLLSFAAKYNTLIY